MFHFDKLCYDNKRHSYYANARQLYDKLPYPNVTNAMIEYYIHTNSFIDTKTGNHKGDLDTLEHHAQRIASLIHLIRKSAKPHPVEIYYDSQTKECEIEDGWHRMRASHYLNENIDFDLFTD